VEIHEPMRLLVVIDATPERIAAAVAPLAAVRQLIENRWLHLVSWDPQTGALSVYDRGRFAPYVPELNDIPVVDRSVSWYAGKRDHLAPARVLAALPKRAATAEGRPS
jgi:hypothetical protein